jgi:hypothetical protein
VSSRRPGGNLRIARRLLRTLRRRDDFDDRGELVGELLLTTADLLDQVTALDSDVPVYARAQAVRAYSMVVDQMLKVATEPEREDAFSAFLAEISKPSLRGAGDVPGFEDVYGPPTGDGRRLLE